MKYSIGFISLFVFLILKVYYLYLWNEITHIRDLLPYRSTVLTFVGDGPGSAGGSTQRPGPPPRAGASSGYI